MFHWEMRSEPEKQKTRVSTNKHKIELVRRLTLSGRKSDDFNWKLNCFFVLSECDSVPGLEFRGRGDFGSNKPTYTILSTNGDTSDNNFMKPEINIEHVPLVVYGHQWWSE